MITKLGKVLLNLPSVRQSTNYTCGVSAVQSVLAYYGVDIREDKLLKKLPTTKTEGTSIKDIIKLFKSLGFDVTAKTMNTDDLKSFLGKGIPVILPLQAWPDKKIKYTKSTLSEGHYSVAIGYTKDKLIFEDPSLQGTKGYINFKELDSRWQDIDNNGKIIDHFGIAVFGKSPKFNPNKIKHID